MNPKFYISLLIGLLSFLLHSPQCSASVHADLGYESEVSSELLYFNHTESVTTFKGGDVYAAQIGNQVSVPQMVVERTQRTNSYRLPSSFANTFGRRVRQLTSFSKHSSWRIFPASAPFFCTTPKLFYVYALREILC